MNNFSKIPFKYLDNTILKLKNKFCPLFPGKFTQKSVKMRPQYEFTTKHHMFGATISRHPRKFYTTADCDG